MTRKDALRLLSLLLPVVLLLGLITQAERHRAEARQWLFAVDGYDPRDLLRGHYLRFRLDLRDESGETRCSATDADCCYCLDSVESIASGLPLARVRGVECEVAPTECTDFVLGVSIHGLDRFYIPEARRREMESRLRDASRDDRAHLLVAVDDDGVPAIVDLLVDGSPIGDPSNEANEEPTRDTTDAMMLDDQAR